MKNKIGLFGGTFNPTHKGHTGVVRKILELSLFDQIYVIPSAKPPHREKVEVDFHHRFEMAKLAFQSFEHVTIDSRENFREGPSYALDTFLSFKEEFKQKDCFWILGIDSFLTIREWHEWERLIEAANFLIVSRPGHEINSKKRVNQILKERSARSIEECSREKNILHLDSMDFEISSSKVRLEIESALFDSNKIDDSVINYINKNNLYSKSI